MNFKKLAPNPGIKEDLGPHAGKSIEKRRFESYTPAQAVIEGTPLVSAGYDFAREPKEKDKEYGDATRRWMKYLNMPVEEEPFKEYDLEPGSINYVGTNGVKYASGSSGLASGMRLTSTEIRKAVRKLRENNATPW